MTSSEILSMAHKAGFSTQGVIVRTIHSNGSWVSINGELERFAALIAEREREATLAKSNASWKLMCQKMVEAEREACAKVCEAEHGACWHANAIAASMAAQRCAAAIRARSTK